jgi:2-C-methyl-D-erythritol 4-phosphate cytidylyltransferase
MNTPDTYIIIAGGGIGSRMSSAVPKQFLLLNDKPILQHTIERFQNCLPHAKITLVLPKFHIEIWQSMCKRFDYPMDYNIVEGGKERFFSIQNALNTLPPKGKVLVHDAVRPLVSEKVILDIMNCLKTHKAVVPQVDITDSMRQLRKNGKSFSVSRKDYAIVQTPQGFDLAYLKKAYLQTYQNSFTDDSSVYEEAFDPLFADTQELLCFTIGNKENIKITTPEDLKMAEKLMLANNE